MPRPKSGRVAPSQSSALISEGARRREEPQVEVHVVPPRQSVGTTRLARRPPFCHAYIHAQVSQGTRRVLTSGVPRAPRRRSPSRPAVARGTACTDPSLVSREYDEPLWLPHEIKLPGILQAYSVDMDQCTVEIHGFREQRTGRTGFPECGQGRTTIY